MVTSIRFTPDGVTDRLYRPKSFVQQALRGHFGTRRRIMRYGDRCPGQARGRGFRSPQLHPSNPRRRFLRLRERHRGRFSLINPRSASA
jgi:hypothetical protein